VGPLGDQRTGDQRTGDQRTGDQRTGVHAAGLSLEQAPAQRWANLTSP
jgi:hypothetical protein